MVPGLKTGWIRKRTLMTIVTDLPTAIPLGSTIAPSPVFPLGSTVAPSVDATSPPFEHSNEMQPPSKAQTGGIEGEGKLYVDIDRALNAMTRKYAIPATNELGLQIRSLCPLKDVKSWLNMDETTKAVVIQAVLDKFDIGDDFHNDSQA
ncbi:hypothetical protein ACSBR2_042216 [Camellia fascicularis]